MLLGSALPTLTPAQQSLYTDRCTGATAGAAAPAAAAWDAQLAALLVSLIPTFSQGLCRGQPSSRCRRCSGRRCRHWKFGRRRGRTRDRLLPWRTGRPRRARVLFQGSRPEGPCSPRALRGPGDAGEPRRRAEGAAAAGLRRAVGPLRQGVSALHREVVSGGPGKRTVMLLRNVRCDTVACPKGQENYTLALDGKLPPLQAGEVEAVGGRCPSLIDAWKRRPQRSTAPPPISSAVRAAGDAGPLVARRQRGARGRPEAARPARPACDPSSPAPARAPPAAGRDSGGTPRAAAACSSGGNCLEALRAIAACVALLIGRQCCASCSVRCFDALALLGRQRLPALRAAQQRLLLRGWQLVPLRRETARARCCCSGDNCCQGTCRPARASARLASAGRGDRRSRRTPAVQRTQTTRGTCTRR
ncbi:MAG: hypothetical protein MZW92_13660 [Comamonadaceae bacterium]|nr:hypothetical protein [Comamonadaceae bacterium]